MLICSVCRKPQSQCSCTLEEKATWAREMKLDYEYQQDKIRHMFRGQPEQIEARLKRLGEFPTYEQVNCFEIDDDIWPVIKILWEKGYGTLNCCAGHPERGVYNMYIAFDRPYFFDFTIEDFGEGWSYTRTRFCALYFSTTTRLMRRLKKNGEEAGAYLEKQRKKLLHFVQNLPQATAISADQRLPGTGKGGKIISGTQEVHEHDGRT